MNLFAELPGTMVLVHPELSNSPAGGPGRIGVVTDIDRDGGNAYVGFGKSGQHLFGFDALLVLKPAAEIQQALKEHASRLSIQDHTSLFRMALLQECSPFSVNTRTALSLAAVSEPVRELGTRSVEEAIGIRQEQILDQWAAR